MEPSVHTDRVAAYLAELRPHLDDLDPSERAEVLDELADALREVATEDQRPLREVLGPPADYVAAYRASAGLEAQPSRSRGRLRSQIADIADTLRAQPWWPHARDLGRLLRPSWWTVRGGVLAVLPAFVFLGSLSWAVSLGGLLFIAAGVAVSMAVRDGRQLTENLRLVLTGANVIAAVTVLPMISVAGASADSGSWDSGYQAGLQDAGGAMEPGQLAKPSGELVTNIHPYTRDGEPLEDVLLFDGSGQPLRVVPEGETFVGGANHDIEIDYQRDADGQPITNLYPLRQFVLEYDDATGEERRRPRTAPTVVLPPAMRSDATEDAASEATVEATAPAAAPSEP
jgi:hypothetical protein